MTLANLITRAEERFIWYKKQLEIVYISKNLYDDWYKEYLRDMRNFEEKWLKKLQKESEDSKIT